jgi:pyrimidine operon attenuation protein/uracil phosphoribosyltransferase
MNEPIVVMNEDAVLRALARMARELLEKNGGTRGLTFMGIERRGVQLAHRLQEEVSAAAGISVPTGSLDITMYRDDLMAIGPKPIVGETTLPPGGIDGRTVVIVDDVLFTGRTARAALNELMSWGRPNRILLCVLVDRGGRELPIQPDVVGREVQVQAEQQVEVLVPDLDGRWSVEIVTMPMEAA